MSKLPAKKILKQKADDLWAAAVKEDWNHQCAVCGKTGIMHAHHLIPRANYATRFDLRNGISLCSWCHIRCPKRSPHQNAAGWILWLEEKHWQRYNWFIQTTANGEHTEFPASGKTPAYFCEQIVALSKFVDEDECLKIVGVRFAQWLEEQEQSDDP